MSSFVSGKPKAEANNSNQKLFNVVEPQPMTSPLITPSFVVTTNGPSCLLPLFQNEFSCETLHMKM